MIIFRLTFRMPEQFLIKTGKKKKEEGKGNTIYFLSRFAEQITRIILSFQGLRLP